MSKISKKITRTEPKKSLVNLISEIASDHKLSSDEIRAKVKDGVAGESKEDLVDIVARLAEAAINYSNACDEAVWLHLMSNGMHPNTVAGLNLPSFSAAIKGTELIDVIKDDSQMCETCAYRPGTLGNNSATTQADVEYAMLSESAFRCHNDSCKGTTPDKKACRGFAQHLKSLSF